jgi:hypothetical protein
MILTEEQIMDLRKILQDYQLDQLLPLHAKMSVPENFQQA